MCQKKKKKEKRKENEDLTNMKTIFMIIFVIVKQGKSVIKWILICYVDSSLPFQTLFKVINYFCLAREAG